MTPAEKITVAIHAGEAVAFIVIMALGMVYIANKLNDLGSHVDESQQKATAATVNTMNDIRTKADGLLDAGTVLLKSATATSNAIRSQVNPTAHSIQNAANSASGMAQQATATLKTAQSALSQLTTLEKSITRETDALRTTTVATTELIQDVHGKLDANAVYVHNMLVSASGILTHVNGITADAYAQYDAWLHPPKCRHFGCRFQRYVLGNLPIAYHAIQAADAAHDLFSGQKIYGSIKVTK